MSSLRKYTRPLLRVLNGLVDMFFNCLFKLIYWSPGQIAPPITNLLLLESASSIAFKIRTRKLKSIDVLESFITRINEINPVLNCVVANRFDEAREEARAVDKILDSEVLTVDMLAKDKPFLGVPFSTKDCLAVKGMIHTGGLYKRKYHIAEEDSDAVALLRSAGAIPIALTNISELCMWWESSNNIHGRTSNPYDTNRIVGGSSGGEGCLQAAAGSAFGIGSDIGGSIRMPSFFNGIFGHKPTGLIVSNKGQFPQPETKEQSSFLGVGPMCRRAEDLLPLLKVISGKNAVKLKLDEEVDIKKINIFYQETDQGSICVSPVDRQIKSLFGKVAVHFEKAHTKKLQKVQLKRFAKSAPMWFAAMKAPSGPSFRKQLTNYEGDINLTWELSKWCVGQSNHTFVALITAIVENWGCKYGDEKYTYLIDERDRLKREMVDILGDDGVFIYPTHPTVAPYHNEPLFKALNFSYTASINMLTLPATHCPMGLNSEGLPMGLQVISGINNDRLCLAVAREIEKAFGGWVPPQLDV